MPTPSQRAAIGRNRYAAGSAIAIRNQRLALAKTVGAVRRGYDGTAALASRLTTAEDMATNGNASAKQIDQGREAYLLVPDILNHGNFIPVPVYGHVPGQEARTGKVLLDIHQGAVLVEGDTLIYWK